MRKPNFKQIEIVGALFGIFFGSLLHFIFELSGKNSFVALFAAVNESPWEHNKLFFTPVLLFLIIEWFYVKNKKTLLLAKVLESLFGIFFIITFFYTYTGALGVESLAVDIASFIVAVILGKYISYKIVASKIKWQGFIWLHALGLALLFFFFAVVTFTPPKIPLFRDGNTGGYGIQMVE